MANELTAEQAKQITNLESYKVVTGAKRFKRTKADMDLGLTPEEALQQRINEALGVGVLPPYDKIVEANTPPEAQKTAPPRAMASRKGDITIRIRPAAGTDADYFEHVPDKPIEIVLDQKWYLWFDTLANSVFQGDLGKVMTYIMDKGISYVLTHYNSAADLDENAERSETVEA